MKFFLPIVLSLVMLTGCGAQEEKSENLPEPAPITSEVAPEGLSMAFEHDVYDPSLGTYTYMICNETEQDVFMGESYRVQKQDGTAWKDLPFQEEVVVNSIEYHVGAGDDFALQCDLELLSEKPEPGKYRLVKEVELGTEDDRKLIQLQAEFQLGESPYTKDAPYGFQRLESLPEVYGAAEGRRDEIVTITDKGVDGEKAVIQFFQKVSTNIPCQLRIVQEFNEGNPMVMDAIFENGKFLWRVRSGGGITEQYFSYAVTDGTSLCLSNGANWDTAQRLVGRELVYLLPEKTEGLTAAVSLIEDMTAQRMEDGVPQYCTWSVDGSCCAALTEKAGELLICDETKQEIFPVTDKRGRPVEITELSWDPDGLLIVFTEDGARAFDPEEWKLH